MERIGNNFINNTITVIVTNGSKRGKFSLAYTLNSIIAVGGMVIPVVIVRSSTVYRVPGRFSLIFNRPLN